MPICAASTADRNIVRGNPRNGTPAPASAPVGDGNDDCVPRTAADGLSLCLTHACDDSAFFDGAFGAYSQPAHAHARRPFARPSLALRLAVRISHRIRHTVLPLARFSENAHVQPHAAAIELPDGTSIGSLCLRRRQR